MAAERGIVLTFPGQNSVEAGMAKALYDNYPEETRPVFAEADRALGFNITEICIDGTLEDLLPSDIAQPALLATSFGWFRVIEAKRSDIVQRANVVLGHSLGEYTAHVVSGSLNFRDGVRVVHQRGKLLEQQAKIIPTSMVVLIANEDEAEEICKVSGAEVANINSDRQIVIAGTAQAITKAKEIVSNFKASVKELGISVGSHWSGAEPVAQEIAGVLESIHIEAPKIPLVANATSDYITAASQIKDSLVQQLTKKVRWLQMVLRMVQDGNTTFIEVGPQDRLTKLVNRIARERSLEGIEALSTAQLLAQGVQGE